jgi:hypothetical protein
MNDQYWTGPYGTKIPDNIYFVVAEDGENIIDKWGGITDIYCNSHMTKEQYINTYCYQGADGYYYDNNKVYYKENECCCILF